MDMTNFSIFDIIIPILLWLIFAVATHTCIGIAMIEHPSCPEEFEFDYLNPRWLWWNWTKLNVVGAVIVAILLNIMCLPISICYWFYKLCTFGRR